MNIKNFFQLKYLRISVTLLSVLLFAACNNTEFAKNNFTEPPAPVIPEPTDPPVDPPVDPVDPPETGQLRDEVQMFGQNQVNNGRQVDIIWVIDASGSMRNEQEALRNNFSSFINSFTSSSSNDIHFSNFDYRMAVVETGERSVSHNSVNFAIDIGEFYNKGLIGDSNEANIFVPTRLEKSTTSVEELTNYFMDDIMLGTDGQGEESGSAAAMGAMLRGMNTESLGKFSLTTQAQNSLGQENISFFRPEAELHFIIVSDEEECLAKDTCKDKDDAKNYHLINNLNKDHFSGNKELFASAFVDSMRSMAKELKPSVYGDITNETRTRDIKIHTIIDNNQSSHNYGAFYKTLSTITDSSIASINADFNTTLQNMGESIVTDLERNFTLNFTPVDAETIIISYVPNGETEPVMVERSHWNLSGKTIVFIDGFVPPADSVIKIEYQTRD